MDVFLAFNHMFVLGTRGLGLIKQLWLLNSWVSLLITDGCRISAKHVGHPQKNTAEDRFTSHNPSAGRNLLRQRSEWPVSESTPLKRCGRLSDWIAPSDGKSLSAPLRAEFTTPGCQWRWNIKPLTCILTLCHFDESDWRCLCGDWGRRGRASWIHNVWGWAKIAKQENYFTEQASEFVYVLKVLRGVY